MVHPYLLINVERWIAWEHCDRRCNREVDREVRRSWAAADRSYREVDVHLNFQAEMGCLPALILVLSQQIQVDGNDIRQIQDSQHNRHENVCLNWEDREVEKLAAAEADRSYHEGKIREEG